MSVLKALRWAVVIALVVVAFAFMMYNADVRIGLITLPFLPDRAGMRLMELLVYALGIGAVVGFAFCGLTILDLQAQLRQERRARTRVQGELTALRNLPLDDAEELETGP